MKPLFRLAVCAGLLSSLIAGGNYACPTWSACLGLSPAEWLRWQHQLEEERARAEILGQQDDIVRRNLEAEIRVIEELRDGRLTLLKAAARFRDLGPPAFGDSPDEGCRGAHDDPSDAEHWCRRVIRFAHGDGLDQPGMPSLADRLEAELATLLTEGWLSLEDGEPEATTPPDPSGPRAAAPPARRF